MNLTTPGTLQISILSGAREVNNFEEREEVKRKMQVLLKKILKNPCMCSMNLKVKKLETGKLFQNERLFHKRKNSDLLFLK